VTVPELSQWRVELRAWLGQTLPPRSETGQRWGEGEPDFAVFRNLSDEAEQALLDTVCAYRRARYDAGYGALTLPTD
jgi:hypothetical protein